MDAESGPSRDSGQVKSAWIAALGSILVAVIGAGALLLSNSHRAREQSEEKSVASEGALALKTKEAENLAGQLAAARQDLASRQPCPSPSPANGADSTSGPTGSTNTGARSAEENGFVFTLTECARSGATVTCGLVVRNTGVERRLRLHARPGLSSNSLAFDDHGIQHQADGAELAGVQDENGFASIEVPSGRQVPAALRFRDMPGGVRNFGVLRVGFEIGISDYAVELGDIAIK